MSAQGPHDDLDAARAVIVATLEAMNSGDAAAAREYVAADIEHVTRDGIVQGPERLFAEFATQLERWQIVYELEDLIDAGNGALVALLKVERLDRGSGKLDWKAWPALAVRVHQGRFVFLEGYVDRRKAFADLGLAISS